MKTGTSSLMDGRDYKQNKVMRIDNINELAEEQSKILGWGEYQGLSEQNGFKDAYINGYNKAKETLYTKEQVMDAIRLARQMNYCNQDYEIIVSLKLK